MKALVTKSKLDSLADVVAEKTASETPLTIDQMITLLNNIDVVPNKIITGTTTPDNSVGNENDIYFQLSSEDDPIIEYEIYASGSIEQSGTLATSVSEILNNSFYILTKGKIDTTFYYYYTDQCIENDHTNYILKTAGNDIYNAALYYASQIEDTDTFYLYCIDDDTGDNKYIRLTASNNIYFTTDISNATIFKFETTAVNNQFLVKGTNIPNASASYYLNSKAGDNGIGFQSSTFTDSYMSFLLSSSVPSFDTADPYEFDGLSIAIVGEYSNTYYSLSSTAYNNSTLKSDDLDVYSSGFDILSSNLTLWTVEAVGNGTYKLKNKDDKYLNIERTKLSLVSNVESASEITISFMSSNSSMYANRVRFSTLVSGYKFRSPIRFLNNNFTVRNNANNNGSATTAYADEWLYIAFRRESTTPIYVKKVYTKYYNQWVEKTYLEQFFASLKVIDMLA